MERYSEYKDSGVKWLGKIPSHWEVMSIKYTGIFENGLTYSPADTAKEGTLVLRSSNIQDFHLSFKDNVFVKKVSSKLLVRKGDIIICSRNGSASLVGKCALVESDIEASFGAFMMRYRPVINPKYAYYLFQGSIGYYKGLFSTTTINQLTKSVLNDIKVAIPNLEEQVVIGSYLDAATSKIDKAIAMQQKMIDLLNERKQIIIQNAVTKGIDENVEMKDSGVEWIGMIPKHWKISSIKHLINLLTDYDANGSFADIAQNCNINNGTPYAWMVRTTDLVNRRYGIVNGNNYCDKKTYDYLSKSSLSINDIIIAKRGDIGKVFLIPDINVPMTLAPNTYLLKTIKAKINNNFLYYALSSKYGKDAMTIFNKSTTLGALYKDDVKALPIACPPLTEQIVIAAHLDKEMQRFDSAITNCQRQITLLQERKQIIINEVVTGKVKVS